MKNILLFVAILFYASQLWASNGGSTINNVTLFLDGAEITRTAKIPVDAGNTQVIITNLSSNIDAESLQVNAKGGVNILSVKSKIDIPAETELEKRIGALHTDVEALKDRMAEQKSEKDAYLHEKDLLENNIKLAGSDEHGVTVGDLKEAALFHRVRIMEINKNIRLIDKFTNSSQMSLKKLEKKISELGGGENQECTSKVVVLLQSDKPTTCELKLRYLTTDAYWKPAYNLRAVDITEPISLEYKAQIFNHTGTNWENVKMKLAIEKPKYKSNVPSLQAWTLKPEVVEQQISQKSKKPKAMHFMIPNTQQKSAGGLSDTTTIDNKTNRLEMEVSEIKKEFDILQRYSILGNGEPVYIPITKYRLPADYHYFCIPKVDEDVFLLARITGWHDLGIIEGSANIYYGNTYVGQSYIDTRSLEDTLDLSLGRDKSVLVRRHKKRDENISNKKSNIMRHAYLYEIVVENTRDTPVVVEVQDQLPVSVEDDIKVGITELSDAEREKSSGKLIWRHHLEAKASGTSIVAFQIEYPKSKKVKVRKSHRISAPN
ncbi:MAG: DUF4139 domain-containing protein [Chitinophagales bacterium]